MQQVYHINNQCAIEALLGTGAQSTVYLCKRKQQLLAAKVYLKNKKKYFSREVQILKKLFFKHLIKYFDCQQDVIAKLPDKGQMQICVLYIQFAQRHRLNQYVTTKDKLPDKICRKIFKDLLNTIIYMKDNKIYHRDLKPQNILFDKNFNIKVVDFGLSAFAQQEDQQGFLYNKLGTSGYKPLQMQLGRYKGINCDIFAAGVILFFLCTGDNPFFSATKTDNAYKCFVKKDYNKFWSIHQKNKVQYNLPQSLKQLFNSFFSVNPQQRPTLQTLKMNTWLNQETATQEQFKKYMQQIYNQIHNENENIQKIDKIIKEHNLHNLQ